MLNMLNIAQTGLSTAQVQVENVMANLANENTEGYVKRVVNVSELEERDIAETGRGSSVDSVTRVTDDYLYDKLITEKGNLSDTTTLNSLLNSIESIFYETDDAGLSVDLNNYFESMENLKSSPTSAIYKADLELKAEILVDNIQSLYKDVENLEADTLGETSLAVDQVNSILKSIGEISEEIIDSPGNNNDLYDKRDLLEKELSEYMDVEISRDDPYSLSIGGVIAVRFTTNVREVVLVENYVPQADAYAEVNSTTGDLESNLIDSTWGSDIDLASITPETAEVQHIPLSGGLPTDSGQSLEILGYTITGIDNSGGIYDSGDSARLDNLITNQILTNSAAIIADWNSQPENVNKQIASLTSESSTDGGDKDILVVTYETNPDSLITGDVPTIEATTSNGLTFDTSIEMIRGGDTSSKSEVQTLQLDGITTGKAYFLGTDIDGSVANDTAAQTAVKIETDRTAIIDNWNNDPDNADQQIDTIVANLDVNGDATGELTITYKSHMGDVSIIEATSSRGMTYNRSEETVKGAPEDSITYTLNNEYSLTVTNGETIFESDGVTIANINSDLESDQNDIVDKNNAIQALVYKINNDSNISDSVTAYNGKYELADDGTKILTNDSRHSLYDPADPYKDRYLYVESNVDGEAGSFVGEVLVNDNNNVDASTGNYVGVHIPTDNNTITQEALDDIHIEIFDEEIDIGSGSLKSMIDNIKTDSGSNHFNEYKEMLDNLAKTLSDYSSDYIETENGEYVYGLDAAQEDGSGVESIHLGLFTGADVKSLTFDANSINSLTQDNLDYLSSIQWKDDIDFKGTGIDTASFSEYYQELRVAIADTREGVIFAQESQAAVTESIQSSYDLLTKVDSDEEMIELIKYQAAYEANAKLITTVDEMLQTLLNM